MLRRSKYVRSSLMPPLALAVVLLAVAPVFAVITYSGSLSGGLDEIYGTGLWITTNGAADWQPARMDYLVSQNVNGTWHYAYSLSVYRKEISHLTIETSPDFTAADISNVSGPFQNIEIKTHNPGPGNPAMPASIYGIKFDGMSGATVAVSFDSPRGPAWGDFYAKDGKTGGVDNTVWNGNAAGTVGLTLPDYDPDFNFYDPHGPVNWHIVVPDHLAVPEPTAAVLLAAGALAILRRRRR